MLQHLFQQHNAVVPGWTEDRLRLQMLVGNGIPNGVIIAFASASRSTAPVCKDVRVEETQTPPFTGCVQCAIRLGRSRHIADAEVAVAVAVNPSSGLPPSEATDLAVFSFEVVREPRSSDDYGSIHQFCDNNILSRRHKMVWKRTERCHAVRQVLIPNLPFGRDVVDRLLNLDH